MNISKTYRETKTNTTANIYNIREVHRDITQNSDGTVKTYEHETVKEQVFMQQEQISREVSNAKCLYGARKAGEQSDLLQKWQNPRWMKCKRRADRIKQFSQLIKGGYSDLPHMKSHRTVQAILSQERRSIQYTCEDLEQEVGDLSVQSIKRNKKKVLAFTDDASHVNVGSPYILYCLNAVATRKRKQATVEAILQNLKNQENKNNTRDTAMLEVSPGVYKKIARPKFPFTKEEQEILSQVDGNPSSAANEVYENYLKKAISTNGRAHELMIPVLEQTLTTMVLLQHTTASKNPVVHLPFPELLTITDVKKRPLRSFPFVPIDFWGSRKTSKDYFACCQFSLEDIIYDKVWIELPLLIHQPQYGSQALESFREFVMKATYKFIDGISDPNKLIALDPQCPDFHQLKQLKTELYESRKNTRTAQELRHLNNQLGRTLKKLKRRQALA
jgi:hypothetical protein